MWDESNPSPADPTASFAESDASRQFTWTDGQLKRLRDEWRLARRSFAYHPVIGITPLLGDPPHEFQIDYRVRTLLITESGELQYLDEVPMHLWLPPGFPNQPPVVRPMAGVFHPNITWEGVYLSQPWQPTETLVTLIARVGELLAYRNWDVQSVVNAVAMEWVTQNSDSLPIDAQADFSPHNGGEPLGRIQQMGPATLEQIRRTLDDMRVALLAEEGAPTPEEVAEFSRQTEATVSLFLDSDVPEHLRQQAGEFDDWCRGLPASTPLWDYLRHQRSRAGAAELAAGSMRKTATAFSAALAELEALAQVPELLSPQLAATIIPPMETLAPLQLKLPSLGRDLEKWAAEASRLLHEMREAPPNIPIAPDGSLGRRLSAQREMVKETVATARRTAQEALAEVEPILRRVHPELAALAQVIGWREYIDLFSKARTLERQVSDWGAAGVQAFFLENSGGLYGPFQFEEPLELGTASIVVRSAQRGQVDVIDATGQKILARGTDGSVTLAIDQGEGPVQTTIRASERCEDLIVQLSFIQQHTAEALGQFQSPVIGAHGWCGVVSAHLSGGHQQQNLRDVHRKSSHRWKGLIADLAALGSFKERLATHHFARRMLGEIPRLLRLIEGVNAKHSASTNVVAAILGKSSRDLETDRLIIPPKLATKYTKELHNREAASREMARLKGLLKQIAKELSGRLGSPRLCGRSEIPRLHAMAPMQEPLASMSEAMSDAVLAKAAAKLSALLGEQLPFKPSAAPATSAPPPPGAEAHGEVLLKPRAPRPAMPTPQPISPDDAEAVAEIAPVESLPTADEQVRPDDLTDE